jgi:hypothetical protein
LILGNSYHKDSEGNYLPILPRGDPNGPRPAPRFSVAGSSPKNGTVEEPKKTKRDQTPLNVTKFDHNTTSKTETLELIKPSKNKTVEHKSLKNESFEHKTSKNKTVETLNKTLETTTSSSEIREQDPNLEEGVGWIIVIFYLKGSSINDITFQGF